VKLAKRSAMIQPLSRISVFKEVSLSVRNCFRKNNYGTVFGGISLRL